MQTDKGNVLILNADDGMLFTSKMALQSAFQTVVTESQPRKLTSILEKDHFQVIVLDLNFSFGLTGGKESIKILKQILAFSPDAQVLITSDYGDADVALEAIEIGARDFLIKPWSKEKLLTSVNLLASVSGLKARNKQLKQAPFTSNFKKQIDEFIFKGKSKTIKQFEQVLKDKNPKNHILLKGEQGSAKGVIANKIHNLSTNQKKIVAVDLAEYKPENHLKLLAGAQSSDEDGISLIEMANGGTLFLDHIEIISPAAQAKLLDILQFQDFKPEQGLRSSKVELRIIAGTTLSIEELKKIEELKQDFITLITPSVIDIPMLRERIDDLESMIRHLLRSYGAKYGRANFRLNETTIAELKNYSWPGNYRELQLICERVCQTTKSHLLVPQDFINTINSDKKPEFNVDELEKVAIQDAIRASEGNLTKAAKTLGLGRSTLYRKMTKYKL